MKVLGAVLIALSIFAQGCSRDPVARAREFERKADAFAARQQWKQAQIEYSNAIKATPNAVGLYMPPRHRANRPPVAHLLSTALTSSDTCPPPRTTETKDFHWWAIAVSRDGAGSSATCLPWTMIRRADRSSRSRPPSSRTSPAAFRRCP